MARLTDADASSRMLNGLLLGYDECVGEPVQSMHGSGGCGMHMRSEAVVKRKRSCASFVLKCIALH